MFGPRFTITQAVPISQATRYIGKKYVLHAANKAALYRYGGLFINRCVQNLNYI